MVPTCFSPVDSISLIPTSALHCCLTQSPKGRPEGHPVRSSFPTNFKVFELLTASPEVCHQPPGRETASKGNPGVTVSQPPVY